MFKYFFLIAHVAEATVINPNLPCFGSTCPSSGTGPLDIIGNFYKFALGISGFLAIVVIVYGAIKYAANSGNTANLSDAKEWIYSALLGILLLGGAYILLNTIGGAQLTKLQLPSLQKITAPTSTAPTLTTVYALVGIQNAVGTTEFNSQAECEAACSSDYVGANDSCVNPGKGVHWICGSNVAMPSQACFRTIDDCNSQANQMSDPANSKYYTCITVDSNRTAWCSSANIPSINPSGWQYDSIVNSKITDTMLNSNPGELCPKYSSVDKTQFWLSLVRSIANAESSWNPLSQTPEPSIGIDCVTHQPTVSEGLLQLSYCDSSGYKNTAPACTQISYSADQGKPPEQQTILSPQINLSCGMGIMNVLLGKNPNITSKSSMGAYWSTVRSGQNSAVLSELKKEVPSCF